MQEFIASLRRYVAKLHALERRPFYLLVDSQYRTIYGSGPAAHYGFVSIEPGTDLTDKLLFLVGMENSSQKVTKLPFLDLGHNAVTAQVLAVKLKQGWGLVFTDVTQDKNERLRYQQLAHELALAHAKQQKLMEELQAAQEALENASMLKSQFIGRMSHEFRTPLSSILGFAELAREDMDDNGRLHTDLQAITRAGQYLQNLVDNLIDQAVIENDELTLRPAACDVKDMVAGLEEIFQSTAQQRGLSLAWWIGPDLPDRLWLDELRLRQVLINLINNAIKYTDEGGVTVSLDWHDDQLSVDIEDTGRGIQKQELETLFEPFNQGSGKASRGAGLGLSISREILQRMGGNLRLHSEPGHGTRAHFKLPAGARMDTAQSTLALEGKKVLVVEKDQDTRQLLEIYLAGAGCNVVAAQNAEEGLRALETEKPDLFLAGLRGEPDDRFVPQKMNEAKHTCPIIAIGTREDRAHYRDVLNLGYDDLLTKPFKRTDLVNDLGAFLKLAKA